MIQPPDQQAKPISKEDLYGKSDDVPVPEASQGQVMFNKHNEALVYEETPIINPVPETPPPPAPPTIPMPPHPEVSAAPPRRSSCLGNIFVYAVFFVLGVGGMLLLRQYGGRFTDTGSAPGSPVAPTALPTGTNIPVGPEDKGTAPALAGTGTPVPSITLIPASTVTPTLAVPPTITAVSPTLQPTSAPVTLMSGWTAVQPGTQLSFAIPKITMQFPPEMKPLACDPPGCASQGSQMPGNTRFTVSFHRYAKPIANFTQAKITDAGGKVFPTVSSLTVSAKDALEYSGTFNGTTTNGFGFTRMHGVMILLDPQTTLEFNHFSQTGTTSNFDGDDTIFSQIVKTVKIE